MPRECACNWSRGITVSWAVSACKPKPAANVRLTIADTRRRPLNGAPLTSERVGTTKKTTPRDPRPYMKHEAGGEVHRPKKKKTHLETIVNLTLKEVEHLYGSRGLVQVGWYSANISLHRWYPIPASPHTWPRRRGAQGIMSEAAQGFKGRSRTPPQPTPVPDWEPTYLSRTYLAHTLYVIRPLVHSCRCTCIRQCRVNAIGIGAGRTRCVVVCVCGPLRPHPLGELWRGLRTRSPLTWASPAASHSPRKVSARVRHTRSICWQAALPTGGGAQRHKLPSATLSLYSCPVGVLSPPLSSKRASSIFSIQSSI